MDDIYDYAATLPARLRGSATLWRYADLRTSGATPDQVRWDVRTGLLSRPFHGVVADDGGDPDLLDRLYSALVILPEGTAIGMHTAAALHGFGVLASGTLHVVVPTGAPVPQIRGISAHQAVLPYETVETLGLPCVSPARTAVDLVRQVRRLDALPVVDAALRCGSCILDDLLAEVACHDRLRGVRQAREIVPLADPRAECRQESQLRLVLHDGRLPLPTPQLAVDSLRIDLGYEQQQVGLEYDGASHLDRARLRSDRSRHNWLESQGWAMRYFTDHDLYRRPGHIVAITSSALRRSRANGG